MLEKNILELIEAIHVDQQSSNDAYTAGEHIYSITLSNSVGGHTEADVHVQWPRLHNWIVNAKQKGEKLECKHSAIDPEMVIVYFKVAGSCIKYSAILGRSVLLDLLLERGVPLNLEAYAAEDLWNMVLKYECL